MAKYTTQIKSICESFSGLDFSDPLVTHNYEDVIEAARERIFSFDFPMFNERYRPVLETKILKHYYFREIGFETYGQWKLKLDDKLNLIMPYYNKLYESEGLEFDPFLDSDYEITHSEDIAKVGFYKGQDDITHDGETSNTSNTTSSNTKKTDNVDTLAYTDELKNTHNDSTDTNIFKSDSKGTTVTKDNTGTERNDVDMKNTLGGIDKTVYDGNDNTSTDNTHWDLHSDTPQGQIDNIDRTGYYSDITKTTDKGKNTLTQDDTTTTTYGKTSTDHGNTTRTDNLKEVIVNSGSDTEDTTQGVENNGGYTNQGKKNSTDTLDGRVQDNGSSNTIGSGTNDYTEGKTHKSDDDIRTSDDYIRKIKGKVGTKSYSIMLEEYRRTLLNIDNMIIEELEDLFFGLW